MEYNTIPDSLFDLSSNRREFIHTISGGGAGAIFGGLLYPRTGYAARGIASRSDVSFTTGTDRREMIHQVIAPFRDRIEQSIASKKRIIVKPNLVGPFPLCATHVDAVRGVLDMLCPLTDSEIIVGDSTGRVYDGGISTYHHLDVHGYLGLAREYDVTLMDLNDRQPVTVWITDGKGHPAPIDVIDYYLDPDTYVISLPRMKTHDTVVATLAIKNILLGAPINYYRQKDRSDRNQKALMHRGGPKGINFSMFLLSRYMLPDFSIIDGYVGMEGNGPTRGTEVEHGIALAGFDPVAVDRVGVFLMGIDAGDVGYLNYCADAGLGEIEMNRINIISEYKPENHVIPYKLHENIERQMVWKEGLVNER